MNSTPVKETDSSMIWLKFSNLVRRCIYTQTASASKFIFNRPCSDNAKHSPTLWDWRINNYYGEKVDELFFGTAVIVIIFWKVNELQLSCMGISLHLHFMPSRLLGIGATFTGCCSVRSPSPYAPFGADSTMPSLIWQEGNKLISSTCILLDRKYLLCVLLPVEVLN